VGELEAALRQERERAQAIAQQRAAVSEKLASLQAAHERSAAAAVRVGELENALKQEQERAQAMAKENAAVTGKLASLQAVRVQVAAAAVRVGELENALKQERERAQAMAQEHSALAEKLASLQAAHVGRSSLEARPLLDESSTAQPIPEPPTSPHRGSGSVPSPGDNALVSRAEVLFQGGDVSGARLLLERASEEGDQRAVFLLAQTFDPRVLSRLGARGIRGDITIAEELYARARALTYKRAARSSENPRLK
jgi:hypothetical protein